MREMLRSGKEGHQCDAMHVTPSHMTARAWCVRCEEDGHFGTPSTLGPTRQNAQSWVSGVANYRTVLGRHQFRRLRQIYVALLLCASSSAESQCTAGLKIRQTRGREICGWIADIEESHAKTPHRSQRRSVGFVVRGFTIAIAVTAQQTIQTSADRSAFRAVVETSDEI